MRKKEIIEIIKNKRIIDKSKILSIYNYCSSNSDYLKMLKELIEEYIELKKQYEKDVKAKQEYHNFKLSCICNHQIRKETSMEDDSIFPSYCYECIFCGHSIPKHKSDASWFDMHFYNDCVYLQNNNLNIFDLVLNILQNKDDDDDIDLVDEFKKLNFDSTVCTINDEKRPENYILLFYDIAYTKHSEYTTLKNELDLLGYLSKIEGIRVQLFSDSIYHILSTPSHFRYLYFYDSSKDLLKKLPENLPKDLLISNNSRWMNTLIKDKQLQIPFKVIINLSPNLTYYDDIKKMEIPINEALMDMCPGSSIITLPELNPEIIQELFNYIQTIINGSMTSDFHWEKVKKEIYL